MTLARRTFLTGAAAAASAVALGCDPPSAGTDGGSDAAAVDSGSDAGPPLPTAGFLHGVASGDPLPDGVILWTRLTPPVGAPGPHEVSWELATDSAFSATAQRGMTTTDASRDYTVKLDVTGLTAGTTYYYRFRSGDFGSPIGRTRTAPTGTVDRLRLAVVTCASYGHGWFHVYRAISQRADLDAVIHLGDYIYEYGTGDYGLRRPLQPANELLSLSDYRQRYAHYRADADLQAIHQQHPFIVIWDDHEFANDAYMDGAQNHVESFEGPWEARKQAAKQAYFEWLPIRQSASGDIFRTLRFGSLADLVCLDTRIHGRTKQLTDAATPAELSEPSRTLLGADQEAWTGAQLAGSTARWKLLVQQLIIAQMSIGGAFDQWDGYPGARERLFDQLASVDGVVVLTGDHHASFAFDLARDPYDPAQYDAATGRGAIAPEFVAPTVTSPAAFPPADVPDPHVKYYEPTKRGYLVLDVDAARVQCAYFHLERVDRIQPTTEAFSKGFRVEAGTRHMVEDPTPAPPRDAPPPLAPT